LTLSQETGVGFTDQILSIESTKSKHTSPSLFKELRGVDFSDPLREEEDRLVEVVLDLVGHLALIGLVQCLTIGLMSDTQVVMSMWVVTIESMIFFKKF
jgi:hypothetical protein